MRAYDSNYGIMIMNLGSPKSTDVSDVKKYLDEFLMDGKVMDYPYWLRYLLVKKKITPHRAPVSSEAYKKIWWEEGSPLIVITEKIRSALESKMRVAVETTMRYGSPTPQQAFTRLMDRVSHLNKVIVLPLYPHYAMSSYETAVERVQRAYDDGHFPFEMKVIEPFYNNPDYINVLAQSIRPSIKEETDYLLFSFHGVPVRHIQKGHRMHQGDKDWENDSLTADCCKDFSATQAYCYRHQVITTANLTAKTLNLHKDQWGISFQSRLGKTEWIRPYTDETLADLPGRGVKNLVVVSPAFTVDCLETLEEISMEGKEIFLNAGGKSFETVPCLNDSPEWINLLAQWVRQ